MKSWALCNRYYFPFSRHAKSRNRWSQVLFLVVYKNCAKIVANLHSMWWDIYFCFWWFFMIFDMQKGRNKMQKSALCRYNDALKKQDGRKIKMKEMRIDGWTSSLKRHERRIKRAFTHATISTPFRDYIWKRCYARNSILNRFVTAIMTMRAQSSLINRRIYLNKTLLKKYATSTTTNLIFFRYVPPTKYNRDSIE